MKKVLVAICFSSLALNSIGAMSSEEKISPSKLKQNLNATSQYYTQLIRSTNSAQPRLAELTMLMTMLPKGGDIHHHYSGSVYAETYLDWVGQHGFCIYRENDVTNKLDKFKVESRPAQIAAASKSCLSAEAIRKDANFYRELISAWSVQDYEHQVHPQPAPDQHFFNTFGYFSGISKYSTNLGLKILKQQAKSENQQYLETMLKSAPVTDHPEFANKIDRLHSQSSVSEMQNAFAQYADFLAQDPAAQSKIQDFVKELTADAADIDDAEFTLRFQTYVSRNSAPSKVFSGLFAAFAASQLNPLIVGVNIVGPEHGVVALRDYTLHMQMFAFLKQRFPQVRLAMHAGELKLGLVAPEHLQHHIRGAVQIAGAERIGHGVDIMHEHQADQLLAELKRRKVAVEINLSSNAFILGLQQQAHPVTMYLRHQVPIVISSDDAAVSRNNLSHEYFLFTSRYQPSYAVLKKTVYNSIHYSFLNPAEKKQQLRQLDQRFSQFEAAAAKLAASAKAQ